VEEAMGDIDRLVELWAKQKPEAAFVPAERIDPSEDMCAKDTLAKEPPPPDTPEPEEPPEPSPPEPEEPPVKPRAPTKVFRCGHTQYQSHTLEEDSPTQVAAREGGFCCERLRVETERAKRMNPSAKPHVHVDWYVRGLYEPLPDTQRRTLERQRGPGWPGMCADPETGLYIGGLGNDCRHYHEGPERCVVHAKPKSSRNNESEES
jgi:hypothetical protein